MVTVASTHRSAVARRPISTRGRTAVTIAGLAEAALFDELMTWPKPGLVSHVDSGSHRDMDAETFRRSVSAIAPFLECLAAAGADDADMAALRRIGVDAEAAMLTATGGVNTHRGAIFALGLLCAAAGVLDGRGTAEDLTALVRHRWSLDILDDLPGRVSHGAQVMRRFGVGGARGEAARGFPSAIDIGLPALRLGRALSPSEPDAARVQCFFALLARIEDTNLLHRGGADGLVFARTAASRFLADGGVGRKGWRGPAASIHRAFVKRRLSPGGSADLLAVSLFLDSYRGLISVGHVERSVEERDCPADRLEEQRRIVTRPLVA